MYVNIHRRSASKVHKAINLQLNPSFQQKNHNWDYFIAQKPGANPGSSNKFHKHFNLLPKVGLENAQALFLTNLTKSNLNYRNLTTYTTLNLL